MGVSPQTLYNIMIVNPDNLKAGKQFGLRPGFSVSTGSRYIGGFIGDNESKRCCLEEHTETWEHNITKIIKTAVKYPQESYAAVVCANQWEWIFLQRVTKNIGDVLTGVAKLLWENVLPRLLSRNHHLSQPS